MFFETLMAGSREILIPLSPPAGALLLNGCRASTLAGAARHPLRERGLTGRAGVAGASSLVQRRNDNYQDWRQLLRAERRSSSTICEGVSFIDTLFFRKTNAAVNRPVATRPEWHLRFGSAGCTGRSVHLTLLWAETMPEATWIPLFTRLPALQAATRVGKFLSSKEFLFRC